jgi:4-hydroxythreonine-4-phosphate dehydrogenase
MTNRPRVAITMGDAAGIGPETTVKSLADPRAAEWCIPIVLGDARVLEKAMAAVTCGAAPAASGAGRRAGHAGDDRGDRLREHRHGHPPVGRHHAELRRVGRPLDEGRGQMCVSGAVDAMVSAPLNKEAMHEAGYNYEGQTEILGELTSSKPAMVMVVDKMRLMLFTNHMALRAVCDHITKERMLERITLAHAALRDMGIPNPKIAVAGLNPHAGENGMFGREEVDHIAPASRRRARRASTPGPVPGGHVFLKSRDGAYDMTVALYHDQGLMAVKLVGFGRVGDAPDRPAAHPHVDRPRHGVRHRGQEHRRPREPARSDPGRVRGRAWKAGSGEKGWPRLREKGRVNAPKRVDRHLGSRTGPGSTSIPAIRSRRSSPSVGSRTATSATSRC